jgi:CubicO group peptidase (beta-lactamase class C family)
MSPDVPLDAWQVGPWNRWAYVHVDEVVPTAVVARGGGPEAPLPTAEDPDLDDLVGELLASGWVDGLAVLHRGALVLERYGGEAGPESLHLSQSVGKSVLGLLVGALAGQGRLDPDAPVTEYVPEVRGSGYDGAHVSHLLDMTAAVDFTEDYAVDFWRYDVACAWCPPREGATARTVLEYLAGIGPAGRAHGERMHYATPTTDLLGVVAERSGGAPLAELLSRELWTPLGAERDALVTVDLESTATIGGGFCATLRDYVRLGALVLDGGRAVVPEGWLARLGAGDPAAYDRCTVPERTAGAEGYALQWWRRDGRPMARGIHGQLIAVDHEAQAVVVILSSWPDATDDALEAAHRGLVDRVCRRLREQD